MQQPRFKNLVQYFLFSRGYRLSRIRSPSTTEDPFQVLQRLAVDVKEPVIFDVGAHHGQKTKLFRLLFPSAKIYAFEPFPESFERLRATVEGDPKTFVFPFGFSDQEGSHTFNSNKSSMTNSLLPSSAASTDIWGTGLLETTETVSAQFRTIDSFVSQFAIPKIDILKLDVQGAEHLVMAGAKSTCAARQIEVMYCEVGTQPSYEGQLTIDEALKTYRSHGFQLFNVFNLNSTADGRLRQLDAILTRHAPPP